MKTQEKRTPAFVLQPQEGRTSQPLDVLGVPTLVKIAGSDVENRAAMFHLTVPIMAGPPLHRHHREDEWMYILEGEVTVEIDGERTVAGPGTMAFAARGTVHTFQNFEKTPARMLVMVTPAGLDNFFLDVAEANQGLAAPDFARTQQIMNSYGLDLMGPPLA
jgi:mannose-6-phosphate isomerase-like protein (cupin superfamily)